MDLFACLFEIVNDNLTWGILLVTGIQYFLLKKLPRDLTKLICKY